jgi:hypothetical protein
MRRAFLALLVLLLPTLTWAKTFHCPAGDVACLIAAITTANASGSNTNQIRLEAGVYPLTDVNNDTDGPNGLPSITSPLTIRGAGADTTILERAGEAPRFRLVHVAVTGALTLTGLTIRGGTGNFTPTAGGGGLFNQGGTVTLQNVTFADNVAARGGGLSNNGGTVTIDQTLFTENSSDFTGGGLFNQGGTVTLQNVTFADNDSGLWGGGLYNAGGTVTIDQSLFTRNGVSLQGGGLYVNGGTLTITRSTVADNGAQACGGLIMVEDSTGTITDSTFVDNRAISCGGLGNFESSLTLTNSTVAHNVGSGLSNSGTLVILNATIADNGDLLGVGGGGISNGGSATLQNTILARNSSFGPDPSPDCSGAVTSQGNNLIGDPTGCTITLQDTDLTGDPGLDTFTDDGTPGNGHFPLLATSPAIDAGNDAACPKRDQIGEKRHRPCDIGAIEFTGKP